MQAKTPCVHCKNDCPTNPIVFENHHFCCNGCSKAFQLLQEAILCDDTIQENQIQSSLDWNFLDVEEVSKHFITYQDKLSIHLQFSIPQMHCASCVFVLENLRRLDDRVLSSKVHFIEKNIQLVIKKEMPLSAVAQGLSLLGYPPDTTQLDNDNSNGQLKLYRNRILAIAITGFCFGNIMLFSLPEYVDLEWTDDPEFATLFRFLNFSLSLPVFLYGSREFYQGAIAGIKGKYLHLDFPLVISLFVAYGRSLYELFSQTGSGYFDSYTGIVFFMLLGRHFQDRQTERLRFVKDYKRYFPLAVHVKSDDTYKLKSIDQLKIDDVAILYPHEVLPFDGELIDDVATLDYAFITGESQEKNIESGQKTFAGGRVLYRPSLFKVIRKAEESSLKSLWNKNERNEELEERKRFTHKVAQYFTAFLLILATSAFFLQIHSNPAAAWKALTTTLIVACPCAILLSETFTQGNALYLLAQNGISVKNGRVLERLNRVKNIFFDKTGTITNNQNPYTIFQGKGQLTSEEISMLRFTTKNSLHPVSQSIHNYILENYPLIHDAEKLLEIKEIPGMGIEAQFIKHHLRIAHYNAPNHKESGTGVWIDNQLIGVFQMEFPIKIGVPEMIHNLQIKYPVSIISGDDYKDFERMHELLGHKDIHFKCSPEMKAEIINKSSGPSAYIGDGLNDIAAFREASVGIALQAKYQRFTPAADVLFPDDHPEQLSNLFQFTKWTEYTVYMSWGISLLYNIIGLGYTLQGQLSPLLAAILMPTSTLSIILFTSVMTRYQFKRIFMTVK